MASTGKGKTKKRNTSDKAQVIRVIVLIFLIILALSNFSLLGVVGRGIKWLFFGIFGLMDYVLPFYCGVHIIWRMIDKKPSSEVRKKVFYGYLLMMFIDAFIQRLYNTPDIRISTPGDVFLNSALYKTGGGFIGGVIDKALSPTLLAGTVIILLGFMALCVIGIIDSKKFYIDKKGEKQPTKAQIKKEREEERRLREEKRLHREGLRRERELERESLRQIKEERKENERARAHDRELKRIERQKELLKEKQEMEELAAGVQRILYEEETGKKYDYGNLVRSQKKVRGVGDFSLPGTGTATPDMSRRTSISDIPSESFNDTYASMYKPHLAGSEDENDDKIYAKSSDEYMASSDHITDDEGYDRLSLPDDDKDREEIEEIRRMRREERLKRSRERKKEGHESGHESTKPIREERQSRRTIDNKTGASVPEQEIYTPAQYEFPPLSLLENTGARNKISRDENRNTAARLLETLETFGVKAEITDISCGPAVTRFEIQPPIGTRVSKIVSLSDEIKLNLAAEDIRIEAPIPGKAAIGIEIPNKNPSSVFLYELLDSDIFRKAKSLVSFAVGEDITGIPVVADIAKMPHILIAGQTGSGKSVCINSLIMSVLYKARPDQVKMIMVDPKVVELSAYNGIPHLLFPVVTDARKASGVLNWTVAEMEARYKRFEETGVKNIAGYNDVALKSRDPENQPMPQLLVIIDELADLMMVAKGDVETAICRLAQLARAAGIHLVIATQRPSVNVITGLIKANVPSKIAFAVASGVDSRTILDMNGAEKLLGKGDMLFFPTGIAKPMRVQGAFVSDEEVAAVVSFLRERNEFAADEDEDNEEGGGSDTTGSGGTLTDIADAFSAPRDDDRDELFEMAARFVIQKEKASIGALQRNFKIGFNRAGRIMDQLADAGVVGPDIGTKPRQVLVTEDELEEIL